MCRIAGLASYSHTIADHKSLIEDMCLSMAHGGPDSKGIFLSADQKVIFGHRRLSLIDLSPAGQQPMLYMNRFAITYNGEIYNFKQLRSELSSLGYHFATSTDTEVILAAYTEWGVNSFCKLEGMFAFAIHDNVRNEVILARDSVGIKPLYYRQVAETLAFSSEIKAFKMLECNIREFPKWPVLLLAYGHIPEPFTIYENVFSLPKGSFARFNLGNTSFSIRSFRHFGFTESTVTGIDLTQEIRKKIDSAVQSHLIADAPLGVFLSGGLDSSILALIASQKATSKLKTLSLFFNEEKFSEKYYQDLLIAGLELSSHQFLLDAKSFDNALPSVLHAMDQPSCDGINTWFISKQAKECGLKAVLSGIGADELFGGYPSFRRMKLARMLSKLPDSLLKMGRNSSGKPLKRAAYLTLDGMAGIYLFLRGYFSIHDIADQLGAGEKEIFDTLQTVSAGKHMPGLDPMNQASWMEFHYYLQNQLLRDADVMGMAHGVEIRVPFLDPSLVEFAFNCHPQLKFDKKLPKKLLMDAYSDQLPEPIWNRNKMGFSFPFTEWFSSNTFIKDQLLSGVPATRERYHAFLNGRTPWSHVLALLQLRQNGHA